MKINVIGMGIMGTQIAALFFMLGYKVSTVSRSGVDEKKIKRHIRALKRINVTPSPSPSPGYEGEILICSDVSEMDPDASTIEAVPEELNIKRSIYQQVRSISDRPFLSNTSSFIPSEIADDVIGVHFFNPIQMGVVEYYPVNSDESVQGLISDIERAGFDVIPVRKNRGYIGNYLLFSEMGAALKLIDKYGYGSSEIRSMYNSIYGGRDIFAILDLIGLDVAQNIFLNLNESDPNFYIPKCIKDAVGHGILGKKNRTSILDLIDEA